MKLLLKGKMYFDNETKTHKTTAPQWVEVDTSFLSNNQYNCIGIDRRVFDSEVLAIRDDARRNKGRCRYCGAIVERGQTIHELHTHCRFWRYWSEFPTLYNTQRPKLDQFFSEP